MPLELAASRKLRNVLDPIATVALFTPEAHDAYENLGFPSSETKAGGVRGVNRDAYIMGRSACLGPCEPAVVAAAFGVFEPSSVALTVETWRPRFEPSQLSEVRAEIASRSLRRLLGPPTDDVIEASRLSRQLVDSLAADGRLLFSALNAQPSYCDPHLDLWHAADLFREHRGDSHIASWTSRGLTAPEACIINDLHQNLPLRSYVRTRGWTDDDLDTAVASLRRKKVIAGSSLSDIGRELRTDIEDSTDRQQESGLRSIESSFSDLYGTLSVIARRIIDEGSYPNRDFVRKVTEF